MLLQFVNGDDAMLQVNAAATLWNLSVYENNKDSIGAAGGIEALVDLLSRTDRDNVRNEVVGALRNLSHHPPNRHRIVQHGGIPLLLRLIDPGTVRDSTRRHAVVTLVQCANSAAGLSAIQACGGATLQLLEETCREVDSQMYRDLCTQLASEAPAPPNRRGGHLWRTDKRNVRRSGSGSGGWRNTYVSEISQTATAAAPAPAT